MQVAVKNTFERLKSFLLSSGSVSVLALGLLVASITVKWFDVPLGESVKSYHLCLFTNRLALAPETVPLSFGAAVLLCLVLGAFSYIRGISWMKVLAGFLALSLGLLVICKMVFYNTALAQDFYWQNSQTLRMLGFKTQMLPNRGIDPTFSPAITAYTVTDGLSLAWHFITWGWYFLMASGLIFVILGLRGREPKKILKNLIAPVFCLLLLFSAVCARPLLAEYHKSRGEYFLSAEEYKKSFDSLQAALRCNRELAANESFALKYGEAAYNLKLANSPYYHLYWAGELSSLGRKEEAESELRTALEISNGDGDLRRAFAKALSNQGADFYMRRVFGSAAREWEKSLSRSPEQIENLYYLSLVYTKLGMYKEAVAAGEKFTAFSRNNTLLSNVYANMGDACYWQRDYLLARTYYEKSKITDPFTNYRAGRSLGGV